MWGVPPSGAQQPGIVVSPPPPPLVKSETQYDTCFAVGRSNAKMRTAFAGTRAAPLGGCVATTLGCAKEAPATKRSAAGMPNAVRRFNLDFNRGSLSRGGDWDCGGRWRKR